MLKLLSFDPSSSKTGYAFGVAADADIIVKQFGVINIKGKNSPLPWLFNQIVDLIVSLKPDKVLIETPFYSINAQTLIKLGEIRGVILLACQSKEIPIEEFTPAEVKISIAGYGRASKEQVLSMINQIYKLNIKDYDIADAIAILHAYSMRMKV